METFMELHRSRRSLAVGVVVVVGGLVGLLCARGAANTLSTVFYAVFGVLALILGAALIRTELRRFTFVTGGDGLALSDGSVPWSEIAEIVLDEPITGPGGPYLVLVPVGGSTADGRIILKLDDV